jgi:hypothetical protein
MNIEKSAKNSTKFHGLETGLVALILLYGNLILYTKFLTELEKTM